MGSWRASLEGRRLAQYVLTKNQEHYFMVLRARVNGKLSGMDIPPITMYNPLTIRPAAAAPPAGSRVV